MLKELFVSEFVRVAVVEALALVKMSESPLTGVALPPVQVAWFQFVLPDEPDQVSVAACADLPCKIAIANKAGNMALVAKNLTE